MKLRQTLKVYYTLKNKLYFKLLYTFTSPRVPQASPEPAAQLVKIPQVIAKLGALEIPTGRWPELIPTVLQYVAQGPDATVKQSALLTAPSLSS